MATLATPVFGLLLAVRPAEVAAVLRLPETQNAARVSLIASLLAVGVACLLGIPAAYAIARWRSRLRAAAIFLLALPLAFPPVASGIMLLGTVGTRRPLGAWLDAHGFSFIDTVYGVALAEFFVSGSFVAIAATAAFAELDASLEESAQTLGASDARVFFTIALPLAAPGIAAGILLAWLRALGEYGATSIVAYHPTSLSVLLYVALSANGLAPALALSSVFALFASLVIAAQWVLRRRLI